ncbi:adenylate kinase 7-like [Eucyclogobius newberryi]|uniref:adenylate kinase 7-like n=1 Tax=Eucyclogobius newberryi TaxID=166745 RepID=UPI003B5AF610
MADIRNPNIKRIFVNAVDIFSSKHIAKFLSKCLIEEDEEETEGAAPRSELAFQIVGTVSSSFNDRHSGVFEYYVSPTREELLDHLLECDVILYNISENATQQMIDEAKWAVTTLHEQMASFKSKKMFILISSVMTWAMTKPQNPDEADIPILEEEFRRRRPHPSFRAHNELEKLAVTLDRTKKTKLPVYVVASGFQYGKGENLFHYFFKVSWLMQRPEVPIFGQGTNKIPMIHIDDLGRVIQDLIQSKPKAKYILAIDDSKSTLNEIVHAISTALGSGKVKVFPEEAAISMNAFPQNELDYLKINLLLEAFLIKELNIQWAFESGMVENIEKIVQEYKVTRKLLPVRIFLVGPPAVGKTTIAKKLCDYYKLHHINIDDIFEEKLRELQEPESQDATDAKDAEQKMLREIQKSLDESGGLSTDGKLLSIVKEKLNSRGSFNQGFVLDGFPHTYEQAQLLFFDPEPESQDSIVMEPVYNKRITPENIFVLNSSDELLMERAQAFPESVAEERRYTQEAFLSRLKRYRERSAVAETLLDYFEELELFPEEININADDLEYTNALKMITEMVGEPTNYGPSPEEQEEQRRRQEQKLASEAAERKRKKEVALAEMTANYQEWRKNLSKVERQEQERQSVQTLPLRTYLMKYVMPFLSEALVTCSRARPEDPVDFLAEYHLRNSMDMD